MTETYDNRQGVKGGLDAGDSDQETENSPAQGEGRPNDPAGGTTVSGGVTGTMGRSQEDLEAPDSLSNAAQRQLDSTK